jgi:hypothetical protein
LYGKAPDFSGDGKRDILWRSTGGNVVIWEMNGGQILAAPEPGVVANHWILVE